MKKMAEGFSHVDVPDPNKIVDFIESSTGSMMAVFEVKCCYFIIENTK